jgi:hypothetical protein
MGGGYLFRAFLFLTGPLLNAQSTLISLSISTVPSSAFIAASASLKFSYSTRAYPCKVVIEVKPIRCVPTEFCYANNRLNIAGINRD